MRKMKKIIYIILGIIVLSTGILTACQEKASLNAETEDYEVIKKHEREPVKAEEGESFAEERESFAEESVKDISFIDAKIDTMKDYDYEDLMFARLTLDSVVFRGDVSPSLVAKIDEWNRSREESLYDEFENICTYAREDYAANADSFYGPYEVANRLYIKRADTKAFSVQAVYFGYSGGAHGSTGYGGYTWDAVTGEEIALEDVITDINRLPAILAGKFTEKYPDIVVFEESTEQVFANYIQPGSEIDLQWTLDYDGISFYFGHYELASYADGLQQLKIFYHEMPDLFQTEYFENVPKNYVEQFETFVSQDLDLDGDYIAENLSVVGYYEYEDYAYTSYYITLDDMEFCYEGYFYEMENYLIKKDGKTFLYVVRFMDNDYRTADVYELKKDAIISVTEESVFLDYFTNPECFEVGQRLDVLGTHIGRRQAFIREDGTIGYVTDDYKLSSSNIVSTVELSAQIVNDDGEVTGEIVCPAGTVFCFDRTDAQTYVDMILSDGTKCRLTFSADWPQLVNGMNAIDCFEELFYAG